MIKILFILFLSVIVKCQTVVTDTTNLILVRFSEPMLISSLLKEKFSIKDSLNNNYKIYRIGIYPDTTSVVLETERLPYNRTIEVRATDVKDKAGNSIADKNKAFFIFIGYNKTNKPPTINFERK